MNVVQTIKKEARPFLDKIAVIEAKRQITYGELLDAVDRVADELRNCGVRPVQRVALWCGDSIEYIIASLAVLLVNAAIVPVPAASSADEVDDLMKRIDVNHLLFDEAIYSMDGSQRVFLREVGEKEISLYHRTARDDLPPEYYIMNPAFIRFSSGTTGASKGVLISHESIVERTNAADKALHITASDRVMWLLSMSFHFVVTILLFLRRSATIVLCNSLFPGSLENALSRHQGTFLYATPFHYRMMVQSATFSPNLLSTVRLAVSTTAPLPISDADDFFERFGLELGEAYGIIEVGLPFINSSGDKLKRGSVGRILPDYELRIVDADSAGIGKVYLKGKGMLDAYFSPWQNRQQALTDGWFNTGDLGRLDEDNYLFLVGREKNVINFAGMKIFPSEVESVLDRHPAIEESLVHGVPHPQYGQLPSAYVVLRKGFEAEFDGTEVRRYCYQHLAHYKVPKEFHCVQQLDKTASNKLKRTD
jgi:long-chain acyl-CoA synthetase